MQRQTQTATKASLRLVPAQDATPDNSPTATSLLVDAARQTGRTLLACFTHLQQDQQSRSRLTARRNLRQADAALNEFHAAFYRVAENANLWDITALFDLAPVIFAMDAQLKAQAAGVPFDHHALHQTIRAAQAVTRDAKLWQF